MKRIFESHIVTTGLAVFSMLFGAGNLMYPIFVGFESGHLTLVGLCGFIITAVLLPVAGLVGMILFDGNYEQFFARLGNLPGRAAVLLCMLIIGPGLALPRIVTLSYTMMKPFLSAVYIDSLPLFALLFLGITFLCTFRENKIVDLLGMFISPALLVSLAIIIIRGIMLGGSFEQVSLTPLKVFRTHLLTGYETLDLLGAIFFSAIVINILKETLGATTKKDLHRLASVGFKSGLLGTSLLGLVYMGMGFLGALHSAGFEALNKGEMFREVAFRVLGTYGAFIIAIAVLMACLSTSIALAAVVGEYVQRRVFQHRICFVSSLLLVLLATVPLSLYGLDKVLELTGGAITFIGYPMLIALTFLNIAYKRFGFKPIKLPVLLVGIVATLYYAYNASESFAMLVHYSPFGWMFFN